MSVNDQYAIHWNNYTSHVKTAFNSILEANEFVDVTLACEGKKIGAHKVLLSACSAYFHDLFRDNPCQHPIIILRDVKYQHLSEILKFIYSGEVSVPIDTFDSFLKTAEALQIIGLTDDEGYLATTEKENGAPILESIINTNIEEGLTDITHPKSTVKVEHTDRPTTRGSDKSKDLKRKPNKTVATPVTPKKRKDITHVKEPVSLKKEPELEIDDSLDISDINSVEPQSFMDTNEAELSQSSELQMYNDVQDLLAAKRTHGPKSKIHKLEERIGKLEASRSFCKGCFFRTRLGEITKDKIKKVNTFCPGCDGLPNYCKSCFKFNHKGMKNTVY